MSAADMGSFRTPPGEVFKLLSMTASDAITEMQGMGFTMVGRDALQRTLSKADSLKDAIQITYDMGVVVDVTAVTEQVKDKSYQFPRGKGCDLFVR